MPPWIGFFNAKPTWPRDRDITSTLSAENEMGDNFLAAENQTANLAPPVSIKHQSYHLIFLPRAEIKSASLLRMHFALDEISKKKKK